jgi:hypothetical protein
MIKALIIGASAAALVMNCFAQAPAGWEADPNMEKKLSGEGKWFEHWSDKNLVAARAIEKPLALKITDLATLLGPFNATNMKISSRVVPTGSRYPCIGFIGTTADNFPAELYVIITYEHVYSVYAMAFGVSELPSKVGFNLAEWQSTISSDKRMAPGDQARYETVLRDIKSKLDSGQSPIGGN